MCDFLILLSGVLTRHVVQDVPASSEEMSADNLGVPVYVGESVSILSEALAPRCISLTRQAKFIIGKIKLLLTLDRLPRHTRNQSIVFVVIF